MDPFLALLVLVAAAVHPIWNASVKRDDRPEGALLAIMLLMGLIAGGHALVAGYDLLAIRKMWPWLAVSCAGLTLYSTSLAMTLKRGDLSAYYPIARSSPLFIVVVGFFLLGETYPPILLAGVALVLISAFALQYRPGTRFFDDPRTLTFALAAMAGTGILTIADAWIMQVVEPPVLLVWNQLLVAPVYVLVFRAAGGSVPGLVSWVWKPLNHVGLAAAYYSAAYLVLWVYSQGGDPAVVASVRQASIPFSVLIGWIWLKEGDVPRRLVLSVLLAAGIVIIVSSR